MGGLHAKSMTSQRYRATYKMADMRYYGNVMTTTRWRLYVILHLQQYSPRLNLFSFCFYVTNKLTNSMEQSSSSAANMLLVKKFPAFY